MHLPRGLPGVIAGLVLIGAMAPITRAADTQPIPDLHARVTDLTGTLDAQQVRTLDGELAALEQRKGAQIGVLMVPTTAPEDIAAYAIRVFDRWKLGRQGIDDGALLLVAKDDHRVRIEVARGLEGAIPDAAAARIIREYITPRFRAGDFYGGIHDATVALAKLVDGEPLPPPLTEDHDRRPMNGGVLNAALVGLFIGLWLRSAFGRLPKPPRAGLVGLVSGGLAWLISGVIPLGIGIGVIGLLMGWIGGSGGAFANRGGFGGWGGGGFGGGGFGGGSGGGFSGGGGVSAGGGASGSW
ncbi:MAG TPA: TPM domain-containing protein [Rhodanobacteraceae bacterium]|nr:TPM domain-containing protein [Rhodanobacteraceae bacterium]